MIKIILIAGIHDVKTDIKAQKITVEGVIEKEKLIAYMKKRVHKYGEILEEKKKEEKKVEEKKEKVKIVEEKTHIVHEFKEVEKIEVKSKDGGAPYFIHYVHAPQLFSDENPNACSIL